MRTSLSFVRCLSPLQVSPLFVSLLFVSLTLPVLFPCALQGQTSKTEIDYTGGLYGYYRMEYNEADQNHLPPVKSFLDYRKADPSRLLLSMGDNFGPEFGASIQLENLNTPQPSQGGCSLIQTVDPGTKETRPESLYKDDGRVAPRADCDNVLNFLMHAGFRAVVPGSQDFMYTAQWLRVAALLLSDADRDPLRNLEIGNFDHKTYLLGANLRITLKGGGGTRCPLLFSQNPLDRDTFRCVGDSGALEPEPLDWLSRLDRLSRNPGSNPTVSALQMLASESAAQAQGRPVQLSELVRDEISILHSAWGLRFHVPTLASDEKSKQAQAGSQLLTSAQVNDFAGKLTAMSDCPAPTTTGDQAEMCAYVSRLQEILKSMNIVLLASNPAAGTAPPSPAASRGIGASVILTDKERDEAIDGLLRTVATEEKNIGYTVAQTADGNNVLIVGVTGQDTMNAVSQTNVRLCPGSHDGPTSVFGVCGDRITSGSGTAVASDPVPIVEAIVRGTQLLAADHNERPFDKVVVMAQMPHTEAEVLSERVSTLLKLDGAKFHLDVVLSEAESGYGTPQLTLSFPASAKRKYPAPVVAPIPSYNPQTGDYPGKVSRLTLDSPADNSFSLANQTEAIFAPPPVQGSSPTTIQLLTQLLAQLHQSPTTPSPALPSIAGSDPGSKAEFALLNDLEKASRPNADVVLLQSRDVELDAIGPGYSGYEVCADETEHPDLCKLRVALDRIFWKGDYLEYVAVTGKSLKSMLALSENEMAQQSLLADTGITQQWLVSYGIVQSTLANVTKINQNNEPLWIPVDPSCNGDNPGQTTYCIGGTPVTDDGYYWLVTSDQLAQDKSVYGTLQSLPPANHQRTDVYITAPLSHYLLNSLHTPAATQVAALAPATGSAEKVITAQNEQFQQMPLWQIEFAKVIASFTSRSPVGGNTNVANFQGVSDARASAPSSQELDLELANRITGTFFKPGGSANALAFLSVGEQTAFAYDRALIGNISGRAINPSYSLNNLTEGAFLQVRLHAMKSDNSVRSVRSLPRSLLVLTPRQYQIEINTPYLFFPFSGGASGEITVQLPRVSGWTDRAGFRREFGNNRPSSRFWGGSYYEAGMEFSQQNGVLSSLTLDNGSTQKKCDVEPNITLQQCFTSAKFVINSSTASAAVVRTLHTPGLYWTFHFQNRLFGSTPGKQISLVTDSNGDYFFGRSPSAELPTQTEYDIPLSIALVLPSIGNLSFAPTYTGFYYKPQRSGNSLEENSFSIAARWYFARDARVPLRRQIPLQGPVSADQTHTGKGH